MQTVIGYFSSVHKANDAKRVLTDKGYGDVNVIDRSGEGYRTGYEGTNPEHDTVGGRIKHFFSGLGGHDETTYSDYSRGVEGGGAMVTAQVQDNKVDDVADLLDAQGATEVDGDVAGDSFAGSSGTGVYDAGDRNYGTGTGTLLADADTRTGSPATGTVGYADDRRTATGDEEQVVPVVREELNVGKRQVQRGGVRVFTHLVSEQASKQVSLHNEEVVVNRRPVDRPATDADFAPGDRSIEVTATGEEPVVQKVSRVVEEVVVGKRGTDHVEEVNDTVRHTEVDVQGDAEALAGSYKQRY